MGMSRSNDKCILSLDAGGTTIKYALVPSSGQNLQGFGEIPVDSNGKAEEIEDSYRQAIRTALTKAKEADLVVEGIGVSTPGPFDYPSGTYLMTHKFAAMYGVSIKTVMEQEVNQIPIRFMHDSHAFLLGEIQNPIYASFKKPCAVMLGTGLGFALMEHGKILCNETGGPKVSIFKRPYRGSIAEEYLSKRGIMSIYEELGGKAQTTVKELDIQAHAGDELSQKVFSVTGWHAAHILAPLILEHSIDCVILGGQISKADELLTGPIKTTLRELSIDCFVGKAQTIDSAPLFGVAHLFEEN